jgi:hypothetical protein
VGGARSIAGLCRRRHDDMRMPDQTRGAPGPVQWGLAQVHFAEWPGHHRGPTEYAEGGAHQLLGV